MRVLNVDDLADDDGHRGLALCGAVPGATSEIPMEGSSPAVWFFDSASNVGKGSGEWGSGVIAFVDSAGAVTASVSVGAPYGELRAATAGLE